MTESGWPTSSETRSLYSHRLAPRLPSEGTSPIAADGGFGPMDYDEDEDEEEEEEERRAYIHREEKSAVREHEIQDGSAEDQGGGEVGDDFDDFEEGGEAADDDFGDFDDGFQEPEEASVPEPPPQSLPVPITPLVSRTHSNQIYSSQTTRAI